MSEAEQFSWISVASSRRESTIFRAQDRTTIARISSGWLLRFNHFHGSSSSLTSQAMVFVPDPAHAWQPEAKTHGWERLSMQVNSNYGDTTERLEVWRGSVFKNCFFNGKGEMHISLVFVPEMAGSGDVPVEMVKANWVAARVV